MFHHGKYKKGGDEQRVKNHNYTYVLSYYATTFHAF